MALALLAASGWTITRIWHWYGLPARMEEILLEQPDLAGTPPVLGGLLARARTLVTVRESALQGVADLGRLYHANGYNQEAEACWRRLCGEDPSNARWFYYLSDLRRAASDYTEMAALLSRTIRLDPEYAPAFLQLANLEFKTGRTVEAARHFRQRLNLLPDDPYASLGVARVELQNGNRAGARRILEQVVKRTPDFPAGLNLYAELLATDGDAAGASEYRWLGREAGRFRDAEDPWLSELNAWCYDPARLRILATVAHQTGRSDEGLSLLLRAVDLDPEDREGYETLGDLYIKLDEPELARDTLLRGLALGGPTKPSPRAYVNLSHAYRMLKQPEQALIATEDGISRLGGTFELYDAQGAALGDLGRREAAGAAFQAALELRPNDANANFNLALVLLALSRVDEAYAHLERSLTLEPTFAKTLVLLGELELERDRLDRAGDYIKRIFESQPGMPRAQQLMGLWHFRSGTKAEAEKDLTRAEQHYRKGIAADPEGSDMHASLGVLLLVQRRFTDALAPLEAYHRLKPDVAQSSLFLGQVYASLGRIPEARRILTEGRDIAERNGNTTTAANCREILGQL